MEGESFGSDCMVDEKELPAAMQVMLPYSVRKNIYAVEKVPAMIDFSHESYVLVADISGFTAFGESLLVKYNDPRKGSDELAAVVGGIFHSLVACVHRHAGDVAKFAGDAIICTFEEFSPSRGPADVEYSDEGSPRYATAGNAREAVRLRHAQRDGPAQQIRPRITFSSLRTRKGWFVRTAPRR